MRIVCHTLSLLGGLALIAAVPAARRSARSIPIRASTATWARSRRARPQPPRRRTKRNSPAQDDTIPSTPPAQQTPVTPPSTVPETRATQTTQAADTFERDDLLAAGEGVFGKGAEGLAGIIERILKEQGPPTPISRARGFGRVRRRAALRLGRDDP